MAQHCSEFFGGLQRWVSEELRRRRAPPLTLHVAREKQLRARLQQSKYPRCGAESASFRNNGGAVDTPREASVGNRGVLDHSRTCEVKQETQLLLRLRSTSRGGDDGRVSVPLLDVSSPPVNLSGYTPPPHSLNAASEA